MFGPNANARLLVALLLLVSTHAFARSQNFGTKSPFGLGFRGGLESRPKSDFITDPQTSRSGYSRFYSFEPFLDFGNFVVRLSGTLHSDPTLSGSGTTTAHGAFSETGDSHSVAYGLQLLLVPFYSENLSQRLYLMAGASQVTTSLKNTRSYTSGTSYVEKLNGSGQEMRFGAGYEFYFVQGYSIQAELGYHTLTISQFGYQEGRDLNGTTHSEGDTAVKSDGLPKKYHYDSPQFSLALNLNF